MSHSPADPSELKVAFDTESTFRKNLGHLRDMLFQGISWSGHERNCCYLNIGAERFANISAVSGLDFMDDARSHALVDWDHDGDLDLWTANRTAPQVRFLRNDTPRKHHHLTLSLQGTTSNRDGIGARVRVETQNSQLIKTLRAGEGFLGQSSKRIHFGLGSATTIDQLLVHWPGGDVEEFSGLEVDGFFRLVQGTGIAQRLQPAKRVTVLPAAQPPPPRETRQASVLLTSRLPLPPMECTTLDGNTYHLSDRRSHAMLLNLWATWCKPCVAELKELTDHRGQIRDAGLDVLALSVDSIEDEHQGDPQQILKFIQNMQFPFNVGIASAKLIEQLQILHNSTLISKRPLPVPTSFLIDANGQLAAIYKGPVSIERLLSDVKKLDLDKDALRATALPLPGHWYRKPNSRRLVPYITRLIEQGHVDTGLKFIDQNRELLQEDYEYTKLLNLEATQFTQLGDTQKAESRYRKAVELDTNSAVAHLNLGVFLEDNGRYDEAMAEFLRTVQIDPTLAQGQVNLGVGLQRIGRHEESVKAFREAVNLDPDMAAAQMNLGAYEARQGRWNEAERRYRLAIKSDPTLAMAHLNLGMVSERDGRLKQAMAAYHEAIRQSPDLARAHLRLGNVLSRQNQWTDALKSFHRAVQIDSQLTVARVQLGVALEKLGQTTEAVAAYREALRIDPELAMAQNNLAWILATAVDQLDRDGKEAVRLAEKAARLTEYKRAGVLDTLAAAYAESGRFKDAVQTINKAIDLVRSTDHFEGLTKLEQHRDLYQQEQPLRMPSRPLP